MVAAPATRYAISRDGCHIAYQVFGVGSVDLVFINSWASNVELIWEEPRLAAFLDHLGSFCRVIVFDKRGTGMSDPIRVDEPVPLEHRLMDILAVIDAVGFQQAAVLGFSDGGGASIRFCVDHADRVSRLILWGATPRIMEAEDWPWGLSLKRGSAERRAVEAGNLDRQLGPDLFAPGAAHDPEFRRWWNRISRLSASPAVYLALMTENGKMDVRDVLGRVSVPTLVMHRTGDRVFDVRCARYLAERIPDATLVELPGEDHWPWTGELEPVIEELEQFLTGSHPKRVGRVFAAVLSADIVSSTLRLGELGDRRWVRILEEYQRILDSEISAYGGRVINTVGDGALALFDVPGKAIHGARSLITKAKEVGLELRIGMHAGEVELSQGDAAGIAVHIACRVAELAGPGDVLVTRTVADLVAGSGIEFEDRGLSSLKGIPGEWRIQALSSPWHETAVSSR